MLQQLTLLILTSILGEARSSCNKRPAGAEMYCGNHLLTSMTGHLPWERGGRVKSLTPILLFVFRLFFLFLYLAHRAKFYKLNVGVV